MTYRETPSKTNTAVILYYSSSEGINIEEPTEKPTNSDLKLKYYYTVHNSWFQDKLLLICSSILP